MIKKLLAASAIVVFGAISQATVLTFDGFSHNEVIPQTYGDSANVDVSYNVLAGFGNAASAGGGITINQWTSGYGDLVNVAWGAGPVDPSLVGNISFSAAVGRQVTLNSFDLAGWVGDQAGRSVRVYDGFYNLLASYGPMTIDGTEGHSSFAPAVSASTLHLQWDFPWAVAADNVNFTDSVVRVPGVPDGGSTVVLGALSLFGLLAFRRTFSIAR
ncbi:MAG: VPDSG-CTERM sorting domain-containing protein [Opitutaceae bacterium]